MKKPTNKNLIVVIGIIALFANLLLPTLSYGQSPTQTISPSILLDCGPYGITLGASAFDLTVNDSDLSNVYAYGSSISGETYQDGSSELPGDAVIIVQDYRTELIGCAEEGVDGWHIDVAPETTNLWDDGHGNTFTPTDFKIITTTNFDTSATGVDIDSTHVIHNDGTLQTSLWWPNQYEFYAIYIQVPFNADESGDLTDPDCFNLEGCTGTSYSDANDISNGSLTIIDNSGDTDMYKPGTFYSGLAFQLVIPSTVVPSGYPYTNTIEFTMVIAD